MSAQFPQQHESGGPLLEHILEDADMDTEAMEQRFRGVEGRIMVLEDGARAMNAQLKLNTEATLLTKQDTTEILQFLQNRRFLSRLGSLLKDGVKWLAIVVTPIVVAAASLYVLLKTGKMPPPP